MATPHKLGKLVKKHDPRTFQLSQYIRPTPRAEIRKPPNKIGFYEKIETWPMLLNNKIGDCTCAAAGHMIKSWSTYTGDPCTPTDTAILNAYKAVSGYIPGCPGSDQGAYMLDVLNYWRHYGIGGHKITAFLEFPTNIKKIGWHFKNSIWQFGGAYIGMQLPLSAQAQMGSVWIVPPNGPVGWGEKGSWGGHCITILEYDSGGLNCITWGAVQRMSWSFFSTYADEAYAILSPDWATASKISPSNFDYNQLMADISTL